MVYLLRVAEQNQLRAAPRARDYALRLLRREVLRLVYNQVGFCNRAPAHEIERLGRNVAALEQLFYFSGKLELVPVSLVFVMVDERFEVVYHRAQERRYLLLLAAGQEAYVRVELHVRPCHEYAAVFALLRVHYFFKADRERVEGLRRSRRAFYYDERRCRGALHQSLLHEALADVLRLHAEGLFF